MDAERAFNDLGVDAVTGVELMSLLEINTDELQIPQRFSKFKEVINYFKQFTPDTQRFLLNKATRGKLVDKLDHAFEYAKLLEKRTIQEKEAGELEKELSALGETPEAELLKIKLEENQKELSATLEEVGIYEK